jgi:hypothetical protein
MEVFMPHQGFNTFSNACERFVFSIASNGPLAPNEAEIVEYYCKEILGKIASSLRPGAAESPELPSPGPVLLTSLLPGLKENQSANV